MSKLEIQGKVWIFAEDNINTDLIMPQTTFSLPLNEQVKLIFSVNRPGWVNLVHIGDILIAGRNFGTGSSRPGSLLLKKLGISAVIAESINGLFYRNSINYALPVMECPGITGFLKEGDIINVDFESGLVKKSGKLLTTGKKVNEMLINIIKAGGTIEILRKAGYLS
jgi:3-isopropylmalate/(R)-2-methylmalate dehydratase small subunit